MLTNSLEMLVLARIGGPDILWSVNKLARSVTKWTGACDRRLARLISYIHHTSDYRQYCHVGNTAQHCRLGLFQDSDFAGDLEDSKNQPRGESCVFLEVEHLSPLVGCARNKRQYPCSSTESEILSLDAGLRMDGLLALDLCDVVIEVLRSENKTQPRTKQATGNRCHVRERNVDPLSNADYVTTNAILPKESLNCASLEDNEAVMKMIM